MTNKLPVALATLALVVATEVATAADQLEGAYARVSLTNTRTGESPEALNRQGLLIMAHGHYAMMTQNPDRTVLTRDEQAALAPDAEILFLREWLDINAHSGRYEVSDGRLIWHRDISEDPKEVDTTSNLAYRVEDDRLILSFELPNGDRYDWVWRQID